MRLNLRRNFILIFLLDIFLISLSILASFLLRYGSNFGFAFTNILSWLLPVSIITKLSFFYCFDLYRGMWRYTSIRDMLNIIKACFLSCLMIIAIVLFKTRFDGISRPVFIIDLFLTISLISMSRFSVRFYFNTLPESGKFFDFIKTKIFATGGDDKFKRTIIIGAGDCGEKIYREIRDNSNLKYNVIGFLDDNEAKIGKKIHGLPVLDTCNRIKDYVDNIGVQQIIIALPSASSPQMRNIVELCKDTDANYKIVPGMGELITGNVTINSIRDVEYRDILGRDPIELDNKIIGNYLENKIVLVTGAAGSIGSGLCRQIGKYNPKEIILFERAESPLYEIDLELKKTFPNLRIVPVLGDIQDKEELDRLFSLRKPEIIFHAAAYKHVPMLENYPWKAITNNIFGTKNLVEKAKDYECEKFVFVSTDKAVNPTNVMGASKRVCEMIVQNTNRKNNCRTNFMTVRFGNVIGSVGSVIPLFKKQIKEGGPVTVTHPDIIRYFMLIPEACQLILQAGAMGNGGEIFVLDMGKPIKIDEMARDLIRFSGFEPDVDIKIEYVGLRPGEKLYEELLTDGEDVVPTEHKKIMIFNSRVCNLKELNGELYHLKELAMAQKGEDIRTNLNEIVPEYMPPSLSCKN